MAGEASRQTTWPRSAWVAAIVFVPPDRFAAYRRNPAQGPLAPTGTPIWRSNKVVAPDCRSGFVYGQPGSTCIHVQILFKIGVKITGKGGDVYSLNPELPIHRVRLSPALVNYTRQLSEHNRLTYGLLHRICFSAQHV
jgi:hypothetical protein